MATRLIYLVRHGQYRTDRQSPGFGRLTALGRRQATRVGQVLRSSPVTHLHCSDLPRARETADLICEVIPSMTPIVSRRLRECFPGLPISMLRRHVGDLDPVDLIRGLRGNQTFRRRLNHVVARDLGLTPDELTARIDHGSRRADRVFRHYFRPARGPDKLDVLVCHGNLIRALFCRAARIPPECWLSMTMTHGGITIVRIDGPRRMRAVSLNETHHLPRGLRTEF